MESMNRPSVHGYGEVPGVTCYHRAYVSTLFRNRVVHAPPKLGVYLFQLSMQLLAHRLSNYREVTLSRLSADMREAKEVKGLRFSLPTPSSILGSISAKFDKAGFVGMHLQSKLSQPLVQFSKELLRFGAILESHNEIVCKADDHHIAFCFPIPPLLNPKVKYVVQVNIGQ